MSRPRLLLSLLVAVLVTLLVAPSSWAGPAPIEDYASYQPQTKCRPKAKPGTVVLGSWIVATYGGAFGGISRPCGSSTSEHQEGRAFDWTLDAGKKADRRRARTFLDAVLAEDKHGNTDAKARRMGIMYLIWNDRMYSAWDDFEPKDYLSSSCKTVDSCSKTLRHRDHLHVSLTRAAGRGGTSWYAGRLG
jgi:hypothetical protein